MSKHYNSIQSQEQAAFLAKEIKNSIKVSGEAGNTLIKKADGLYVPAKFSFNVVTQDLISADADNDLRLGSDNKLLSQPADIDFLADYILASN